MPALSSPATATPRCDTVSVAADFIAGRAPATCLVIAELGVNHNGAREQALRLLECAREAGADAVKLQIFEPAELCSVVYRADEIKMLEGLRLTEADFFAICAAARALQMPVFATPFDEPSLDLLLRLEIPVIKIASGEVTHTPFLARVACTKRPVILSTGACEWADVDRAVATLRENGCRHLSLLHCTSAYPPPDAELHLRVLPALQARYPDCLAGFSDHSLGGEAAVAAVALGARLIEKHLTLNCDDAGPDHAASADPAGFAALVKAVRRTEQLLGSGVKKIQPCEGAIGRSVVAARDLPADHTLRSEDFAFKRAQPGVRPYAAAQLLGRRLRRAVARDALLTTTNIF